ncbi:MAG: hypothetical protein ACRYF5_15270 [Janthinobacterium lividum]
MILPINDALDYKVDQCGDGGLSGFSAALARATATASAVAKRRGRKTTRKKPWMANPDKSAPCAAQACVQPKSCLGRRAFRFALAYDAGA